MVLSLGNQSHQPRGCPHERILLGHLLQAIEIRNGGLSWNHWGFEIQSLAVLQDSRKSGFLSAYIGSIANAAKVFRLLEGFPDNLLSMHSGKSVLPANVDLADDRSHCTCVNQNTLIAWDLSGGQESTLKMQ